MLAQKSKLLAFDNKSRCGRSAKSAVVSSISPACIVPRQFRLVSFNHRRIETPWFNKFTSQAGHLAGRSFERDSAPRAARKDNIELSALFQENRNCVAIQQDRSFYR